MRDFVLTRSYASRYMFIRHFVESLSAKYSGGLAYKIVLETIAVAPQAMPVEPSGPAL